VAQPLGRDDLALIAAGGALGAAGRYLVGQAVAVAPGSFPWPTFWVNVTGALALGVVVAVVAPHRRLRLFLAPGLLGAWTTFSTLAVETDRLLSGGHGGVAAAYVAASVVVGVAGAAVGLRAGRAVVGGSAPERGGP
jgi:CrcB protein